jgi:ABC-type oligopeptide transport system substrate-binding subunit
VVVAVDRLIDAANRQPSPAKAVAGFRKAEMRAARDMPKIPLWFYRDAVG